VEARVKMLVEKSAFDRGLQCQRKGTQAPCLPHVQFASSLVGGDIVETCYVWNAASAEFFSI